MLKSFDEIVGLPEPINSVPYECLCIGFRDFLRDLHEWEVTAKSQASSPLVWSKLDPSNSTVLWFRDIMAANSLTHCWAFEIVARTHLDILNRATTTAEQLGNLSTPQAPIGIDYGRSLIESAEMICDSMSYLFQPELKLYGPGSAIFTLSTAIKTLESDEKACKFQLSRCQKELDRLASVGISFPRI